MRSKGLLNLSSSSSSSPGGGREATTEARARRGRSRGTPGRHDPPLRVGRGRLLRREAPRFRAGVQGRVRQSKMTISE